MVKLDIMVQVPSNCCTTHQHTRVVAACEAGSVTGTHRAFDGQEDLIGEERASILISCYFAPFAWPCSYIGL